MADTILLSEIRKSDKKPKELLEHLAKLIKRNPSILNDYEISLNNAKGSEKGTCVEALEFVTQENQEIVIPHLKSIIACLKDKAPRVKWESARIIANIASKYPEKAADAVDNLLENTKDSGTVVRWSTAFALGEIMKFNTKVKDKLKVKIEKLSKDEQNSGVRNVYLKTLKVID